MNSFSIATIIFGGKTRLVERSVLTCSYHDYSDFEGTGFWAVDVFTCKHDYGHMGRVTHQVCPTALLVLAQSFVLEEATTPKPFHDEAMWIMGGEVQGPLSCSYRINTCSTRTSIGAQRSSRTPLVCQLSTLPCLAERG